ncbi:MAG: hypothetical protein KBD31_02835 [Proteobacteria bacterium]|nr:hypothetical protein [Pseudomonadota bacterium]
MSFFDQEFYRVRKKTWNCIEHNLPNLIKEMFDLLKNKENTSQDIKSVLDSTLYKNQYQSHVKKLFTHPLDDSLREDLKKNLDFYPKGQEFIYTHHLRFLKKILKNYINDVKWYNPFLILKITNCVDDIIEFEIDTINIEPMKENQEVSLKNSTIINDFSSILNQNLEVVTDRLENNSINLKDYMLEINKIILNIASKTREHSDTCSSIHNKASGTSISIEQLSSEMEDITKQIYKMSFSSQKSRDQAKNAESIVNDLIKSVSKIDEVVLLISEIANQTNLLALNASIESARSGNAGKGFAVVASEVKKLATQTSEATEEIKQKIKEIQNHTGQVSDVITDINTTIFDVNHSSGIVYKAVEEQSLIAKDVYKNITDLVSAFHHFVGSLGHVKDISSHAEENITKISMITQNITSNASNINDIVKKFSNFELK